MSTHPWQKFEIGLVTIQFETAFIIGAAEGDNLFDAVFVADANGLPCIPGESLAGVLRHAFAGSNDPLKDPRCRAVFGFQDRADGEASRVRLSFAHVHGQDDRPVRFRGAPSNDPVLSFLAAGVGRDHVRIGAHGAVDGTGKFDELVVPAGARFTFEVWLAASEQINLHELVRVLERAEIRIGGKSRRGFGRISVQALRSASFDLTRPDDLDRLAKVPVDIHESWRCDVLKDSRKALQAAKSIESGSKWVQGTLALRPIGTWMVGGGIPTGAEPPRTKDAPWDRVPLTERRITWHKQGNGEVGKVTEPKDALPLVPGSSVKGSLRHRTGFHARRLNKDWLVSQEKVEFTAEEKALFGEVRSGDTGEPGRVLFSDVQLTQAAKYVAIQHVSLDRFTQGPMDHLLYDEVALGDCELKLSFSVQVDQGLTETARKAFVAALDDLCSGRLAIGAGRGHGRFKGEVSWSDQGDWIGGHS